MKYGEWIPFHASLCEGDKRGLSRATRFVYLELCLKARRYDGAIPLPRGFRSDADAVHDLIGGDRREVRVAMAELTAVSVNELGENEQVVSLTRSSVGTILTISAHGRVVGRDKSTSRVRKFRERQSEESRIDSDLGNAFHPVSETQMKHVSETLHRTEQNRTEEKPPKPPSPPAPVVVVVPNGNATNDVGQVEIPGASDPPLPPKPKAPTETDRVYDHWREAMKRHNPRSKPAGTIDDEGRRLVRAAFKSGRTVDDLELAVEGLFLSPHHTGVNDRKVVYLGFKYAMKPGNLDGFITAAVAERERLAVIPRDERGEPIRHIDGLPVIRVAGREKFIPKAGQSVDDHLREQREAANG